MREFQNGVFHVLILASQSPYIMICSQRGIYYSPRENNTVFGGCVSVSYKKSAASSRTVDFSDMNWPRVWHTSEVFLPLPALCRVFKTHVIVPY